MVDNLESAMEFEYGVHAAFYGGEYEEDFGCCFCYGGEDCGALDG